MLACISRYKSSLGAFEPGDLIDSPELEAALLQDSPGSFERAGKPLIEVFAAEVTAPEADKMIRRRGKA